MAFIKTISAGDAHDKVREMYARQQGEWGYVPDYAKVFCHRPEVMARWGKMLAEIKRPVDERRLELATFAAAHALRHSSCSLAHGVKLARMIGAEAVIDLANDKPTNAISDAERAMMQFARKVARDASTVTAGDVAALREIHGYADAEIFDIAAVAASRSFFTKLLDALGSEPDAAFMKVDADLRRALTVGRAISCREPEVLDITQEAAA